MYDVYLDVVSSLTTVICSPFWTLIKGIAVNLPVQEETNFIGLTH